MKIDLNIFRTIIVLDLQQNYFGRHLRNSLFSTKTAAHYKDNFFQMMNILHATIKYTAPDDARIWRRLHGV